MMIGIAVVEGAWRVLRGNTLWIKTALAFVVRAPAGQIRLAPATSSPCEAWLGSEYRIQKPEVRIQWAGGSGKWGGFWLTSWLRVV